MTLNIKLRYCVAIGKTAKSAVSVTGEGRQGPRQAKQDLGKKVTVVSKPKFCHGGCIYGAR